MSDLEQQIAQWRAELARSQSVGARDIDELDDHLREEIGRLKGTGLSETETFLVARHRLGDTSTLATEFRKVNGDCRSLERASMMAIGIVAYLLGGYAVAGLSASSVLAAALLGIRGQALGLIGLGVEVALVGCFVVLASWTILRWSRRPLVHVSKASRRPVTLLLTVALVNTALVLGQRASSFATIRLLSAEEFGSIALTLQYGRFAWWFLATLALTGLAVMLRARALKPRAAGDADPSGA
jgi:hypothetical protein